MKMFHKILGCSAAAAAVFAFSASTTQAQNILVNGSFETQPAGFTANPITVATVGQGWANNFGGSAVNHSDMSSSPDFPQSGSYALITQNALGNNWNPQGTYQIVPGLAGSVYSLSVYALADTAWTGSWTTPIDIQIQYFDANLNNLATTDLGWSAISALDTWQQYTVTSTSPVGTAYVSAYLMAMDNGQTATDVAYFDNAVMTGPVPEPTTLALAGLGGVAALSLIRRRKS